LQKARFALPTIVISAIQAFYGFYLSQWFFPPTTEEERVLIRLLLHTALMEIATSPSRQYAQSLQTSTRIFAVLGSERLSSTYSRFLCAAVSDPTLQVVSAVGVSVIEVVMRTTVFQRDRLIKTLSAKVRGTSKDNMHMQIESAKAFRSEMIVSQSLHEFCDVLVVSVFFILIMLPDGPLEYSEIAATDYRGRLRNIGFKCEDFVGRSAAIQVVFEIATDISLIIIEAVLGVHAVALFDYSSNKAYVALLSGAFCMSGLFYHSVFFILIFIFPIRRLNQKSSPMTIDGNNTEFADLGKSWIKYITQYVEIAFVHEWAGDL